MRRIYSDSEKKFFVFEYFKSHLTQKKFCEKHALVLTQFKNWLLKYRPLPGKVENQSSLFSPVQILNESIERYETVSVPKVVTIYFDSAVRIEIPPSISSQWVADFLRFLQP